MRQPVAGSLEPGAVLGYQTDRQRAEPVVEVVFGPAADENSWLGVIIAETLEDRQNFPVGFARCGCLANSTSVPS